MAAIQGDKDMWLRKHDDVVFALMCVCVLAGYSKDLSDSAKCLCWQKAVQLHTVTSEGDDRTVIPDTVNTAGQARTD